MFQDILVQRGHAWIGPRTGNFPAMLLDLLERRRRQVLLAVERERQDTRLRRRGPLTQSLLRGDRHRVRGKRHKVLQGSVQNEAVALSSGTDDGEEASLDVKRRNVDADDLPVPDMAPRRSAVIHARGGEEASYDAGRDLPVREIRVDGIQRGDAAHDLS